MIDYEFIDRFKKWYGESLENIEKGRNLEEIQNEALGLIEVGKRRIKENEAKGISTSSLESINNDLFYLIFKIKEIT